MSISHATEQLLRDLAPQVLGATMRRFGDFAAAEDAVQEALIAAATQWPREGVPDNPRGWLIQVASRRMTDHIRSESARRRREGDAAQQVDEVVPAVEHDVEQDDTLILLFMCCHETLTSSSAIALTLRAVGGLTTAEIARRISCRRRRWRSGSAGRRARSKRRGFHFVCPRAVSRRRTFGRCCTSCI
jgi:RNA polymerase sigma factor (sigma-70 family)